MTDAHWMRLALAQAQAAGQAGEVPVGAVIVRNGELLAVGRNAPIDQQDPSAHAEIVAIRSAARKVGNYRLEDCDLFVTLEPCAMCSGAILQARMRRVVFGAADPKTGAAGSVLNLFATPQINHHTDCEGGLLADDSTGLLQQFFQHRRDQNKVKSKMNHPLRQDALRTLDALFENLPGYPWAPHCVSDLPSLQGLRMHYLDEGPRNAPITYVCLHGNPAWSYLYRKMMPIFLASGARVVAPDLIGFGKSDKPKSDDAHTFTWHRSVLLELIERLDLQKVVLVVQDWGGLLGLTLPMARPHRYVGLLAMNTMLATGEVPLSAGFLAWREMCAKHPDFDIARLFARGNPHMTAAECAAYSAPFPDRGHRAATRAFPAIVPEFPDSDGAALSRDATAFWANDWAGQTLLAIGQQDPVLGTSVMLRLQQMIRNCPAPLLLPEAGHFVQEHGETVARAAVDYFHSNKT